MIAEATLLALAILTAAVHDTNRYFDFAKGQKEIVDLFASADCICVSYVVLAELCARFSYGTVVQHSLPLCSRDEHFNHLKQIARI